MTVEQINALQRWAVEESVRRAAISAEARAAAERAEEARAAAEAAAAEQRRREREYETRHLCGPVQASATDRLPRRQRRSGEGAPS